MAFCTFAAGITLYLKMEADQIDNWPCVSFFPFEEADCVEVFGDYTAAELKGNFLVRGGFRITVLGVLFGLYYWR